MGLGPDAGVTLAAGGAASANGPWLPACEAEPIHAPGAIQPFGAMLLAREAGLFVTHASANLGAILGRPAASVLGRPLGSLFGFATVAGLLAAPIGEAPAPGVVEAAALAWDPPGRLAVAGHRIGDILCVEIEPDPPPAAGATRATEAAQHAIQALRQARDLPDLCATAAAALRRLTGFDRTMVYRFDATGHGEVVAEALAPGLEPYLGLRYPASDIPRQARRLYLRQRLRVIGDVEAPPVPLLAMPGQSAAPDIGLSVLRAASPIHLEYMRNMGARATLVVSLLVDGMLWGMLVCHDRRPCHVAPALRLRCDLLGQVTSLMVATLGDVERRTAATRRRGHVASIAGRLAASRHGLGGLCQALARNPADLLGLAAATGAVVRLGGRVALVGDAPPRAAALLDALLQDAPDSGDPLADHAAGDRVAGLCGTPPEATPCGVLVLPISRAPGDGILWLRPALTRTVRWGGDPGAAAVPDPATGRYAPRRSFAAWQEELRGQAEPWTEADLLGVRALRREIDQVLVRHAEAEWGRLRHHDPLTGLPNRNLLRDCIEGWCAERPQAGLLLVGIDRFKGLNDSLGEAAGDALLRQVAARLIPFAGPPVRLAARVGGDEFALFCPDLDGDGVAGLAADLGAALAEPCSAGGRVLRLSTSIGCAVIADEALARPAQELLARADLALLAAKRGGGNRRIAFDPRLRAGASRRLEIEQELRAALDGEATASGRFRLLYQPTFILAGAGAQRHGLPLRGFEALLRWDHPTLGDVPPGEFIPIAEECGLIAAIGDWVLEAALRQVAAWRALEWRARDGAPDGTIDGAWRVAVNVSPLQLGRPGFAADVLTRLAAQGVPPRCLTIEVTEGVFADQAATAVIAALRAGGLHIAVDDFGIGYSSLSYLRRLPVDELKLDRSFLQRQDGGARHEEFLAALVTLARAAGLGVLAEGVETEAHLAAVAAAGCDAVQGWLFAPALPPGAAADWLLRAAPAPLPAMLPLPLPQVSFRDIVDHTHEAVLVTDADLDAPGPRIVYCNAAFTRLGGWPLTELIGRSPRLLQGPATDRTALRAMVARLRAGLPAEARVVNYTRSGMPFRVELRCSPLRDQAGRITHFVAIQRDISHELPRIEAAEPPAERDALTGLANRRGLQRFVDSLTPAARDGLWVASVALDGLAEARARHGGPVADAMLLGIADLLTGNLRRADGVGRAEGDSFVICMPGLRPTEARPVAARLRQLLARARLATPAGPLQVDARLGLAALRPAEESLDATIERAGAALAAGRATGRRRVVVASA